MSEEYSKKEEARLDVISALIEYKKTSENYGDGIDQWRNEIDDALCDAGFEEIKIEGA